MSDELHDADPPLFEVGRVMKAHGLNGEVYVYVLTDRPEVRYAPGTSVLLDGIPTRIASSRPHQRGWLVRFDDVTDRTTAEQLRGRVLEAGPLEGDDDTDTFWAHELVGLTVLTEDSEDLGDVVDVIELPAAAGYDLLEVKHPDGRTWYLPAADDLVQAYETEDGDLVLVVVDPPEGLLDESRADVVRSEGEGQGTPDGVDSSADVEGSQPVGSEGGSKADPGAAPPAGGSGDWPPDHP